ncbi:ribokinase [Bacillus shivajii]|uniref:ribokinase n=1 Tax=Bacillus shivajii TaxID=1983719 RepID=UPI001CFB5CFA|nr:ribokinase [Bacillus shivajii]UCZ52848.1 ribokinase [Bacillus shivajii]
MGNILVIGSLNVDLVSKVPHLPKVGETILSTDFHQSYGGKGANQAVAAANLGANVSMIGKVGTDENGKGLINSLVQAGVSTYGLKQDGTTGMAFINVDGKGDNQIVIVPGANDQLIISDIDEMKSLIEQSDYILIQLEIPLDVVEYSINLAVDMGKEVILNPAPMQEVPNEILRNLYALIPNETELQALTGKPVATIQEIAVAAKHLQAKGVGRIIVTMGSRGSYLINDDEERLIPAYQVNAVDATAAGDAYIAAFAVGKTKGLSDREAAEFANKTSAIVVTRKGAQTALPTLEEVEQF